MVQNDSYNIEKEFEYATVKAIVLRSLQKIVKQETLKKKSDVPYEYDGIDDNPNNVGQAMPSTPLLKLKIRNTTKYLNWRLSILKRDNFTCRLCHASVKQNKRLRLEVHHPKAFDDICNENSVSTADQALTCKELWSVSNGISICYRCHNDVEKLRTKLRNMFWLDNTYM